MLALENDAHSENDLFAAERFVYAIDHASQPSGRARQAAELLRHWDGRMFGSSAAATIAGRSAQELTRLLLEPRLGGAPDGPKPQETRVRWKTYQWQMRTVWLRHILLHH